MRWKGNFYLQKFHTMATDQGQLASQSDTAFDRYISHVTCLCDTLYSEGESEKSRVEYQIEDIDISKSLIPEEGSSDGDVADDFDFGDMLEDHDLAMDFRTASFDVEADSILDEC